MTTLTCPKCNSISNITANGTVSATWNGEFWQTDTEDVDVEELEERVCGKCSYSGPHENFTIPKDLPKLEIQFINISTGETSQTVGPFTWVRTTPNHIQCCDVNRDLYWVVAYAFDNMWKSAVDNKIYSNIIIRPKR